MVCGKGGNTITSIKSGGESRRNPRNFEDESVAWALTLCSNISAKVVVVQGNVLNIMVGGDWMSFVCLVFVCVCYPFLFNRIFYFL